MSATEGTAPDPSPRFPLSHMPGHMPGTSFKSRRSWDLPASGRERSIQRKRLPEGSTCSGPTWYLSFLPGTFWLHELAGQTGIQGRSPVSLSTSYGHSSLNLGTQVHEGRTTGQGSISWPPTGFAATSGHHLEGAQEDQ